MEPGPPPQEEGLGHKGSRSPGGWHQPGPAPTALCRARHPGTHLAARFSCYAGSGAKRRSPAPHFTQVPHRGEEMNTHGRKERSAARPLIALQAGSTAAGLCLSPSKGGKKAQKTLSQGARPQHHCRKLCKASFDTKGTKRGGGCAAAGAPQALGSMGQAAARLQGGPEPHQG